MKLSLGTVPVAIGLAVVVSVIACSNSEGVSIGNDCASGFCADSGPVFVPPKGDGGDAEASATPVPVLACVGTECPAPYATCSKTPSFLCETNLQNDPNNCGACGVVCETIDGIALSGSCVNGSCTFECQLKFDRDDGTTHVLASCNGLIDDGCETDLNVDTQNCGACGNTCAAGQRCLGGNCGCPAGKTDCNGCIDTHFNDYNCGTCNNACDTPPPTACTPELPNTDYGCGNSACGALKCNSPFADCNNDLTKGCGASDGCETDVSSDVNNCGGCGVKCGPGQECRDDGLGSQCYDTCAKANLTACSDGCHDLVNDPFNCGACGYGCPNPRAHQKSSCEKGYCAVECLPGFADCNGDPNDGCEVDLSVHPANCGSCGHACDFGIGQPCIEGKCLMVECDAGVTR